MHPRGKEKIISGHLLPSINKPIIDFAYRMLMY